MRKTDSGFVEILSEVDLQKDETGKIGAWMSNLLVCVQEDPRWIIFRFSEKNMDGVKKGLLLPKMDLNSYSYESYPVNGIAYQMNMSTGVTRLTGFDIETPVRREDILYLKLYPREVLWPEEESFLPYISELKSRGRLDFLWFLNCPEFFLNGLPLRLALCPILEEEGIEVMLSIRKKDGSGYSLPLIPCPDF